MLNKTNPILAINGGLPVTKEMIPIHKPFFDNSDIEALIRAFESKYVSGDGPLCREFEKKIADYVGTKYAFYFNSATTALELAFRIKNFKEGSEVIVPNFTYTSSSLGPLYNNLKIKLCDVNPKNGLIDVTKIESLITNKTVAIVPVDYAGIPADMDSINEIAKKYGLYVVHDTAQSLGSKYKGRMVGSLGDVSTFSFHGTKNITTGEGGALTTDSDELAERIKVMRDKGTDKYSFLTDSIDRGYYEYVDIGNSYVQSNILAALGISQIDKVEQINNMRAEIALYYIKSLRGIDGIEFLEVPNDRCNNWHIFGILVPPQDKYWILDALRAEGIHVNVHYTPLHRNRYYKHLGSDEEFPGSLSFFSRLLRIPIYPCLSNTERELVAYAIRKVIGV